MGNSMLGWRTEPEDAPLRDAELLFEELIGWTSPSEFAAIVHETRDCWHDEFIRLAEMINVSKILLWISKREPDYSVSYVTVSGFFGEFPQLIEGQTLSRLSAHFDHLVTNVSDAGMPAPLLDRFTGAPGQVQCDHRLIKG